MRGSYEINRDLEAILDGEFDADSVNPETGEIDNAALNEKLDALVLERGEKMKQLGLWIRDESVFLDDMKRQKAELDRRIKARENRVERLREWVTGCMELFGDKRLEFPEIVLRISVSRAVEITDAAAIPEKYLRTVEKVEPMKKEIKQAIESGEEVPGAVIAEKTNLQWR